MDGLGGKWTVLGKVDGLNRINDKGNFQFGSGLLPIWVRGNFQIRVRVTFNLGSGNFQ